MDKEAECSCIHCADLHVKYSARDALVRNPSLREDQIGSDYQGSKPLNQVSVNVPDQRVSFIYVGRSLAAQTHRK